MGYISKPHREFLATLMIEGMKQGVKFVETRNPFGSAFSVSDLPPPGGPEGSGE